MFSSFTFTCLPLVRVKNEEKHESMTDHGDDADDGLDLGKEIIMIVAFPFFARLGTLLHGANYTCVFQTLMFYSD